MDMSIQNRNSLLDLIPTSRTASAQTLPDLQPAARFPRLTPSHIGAIGKDLDFLRKLGPHVLHTIEKGDTLEALLMKEGYSRHEIYDKGILKQVCEDNHLEDPNNVAIGTTLSLRPRTGRLPRGRSSSPLNSRGGKKATRCSHCVQRVVP